MPGLGRGPVDTDALDWPAHHARLCVQLPPVPLRCDARRADPPLACRPIDLAVKLNFSPTKAGGISELHSRTAKRIQDLINANNGLYIKLGQQLGTSLPGVSGVAIVVTRD
jgi:hypothetical protein